jgi:hypothetical protein
MVHISHKHERICEIRLQKAIQHISKWGDETRSQISIEKTKSILFSRKNYQIVNTPTMNIWIKGERIEQVRQRLSHTKWGADQGNLIEIYQMINLNYAEIWKKNI